MFSALLLRYTVNNRSRYVCNPYCFLIVSYHFAYYHLSTIPPATINGWKLICMKVARDCMLPPCSGGGKLGGKENAASSDQSIGYVGTVVPMLFAWNDFERAHIIYVQHVCLGM